MSAIVIPMCPAPVRREPEPAEPKLVQLERLVDRLEEELAAEGLKAEKVSAQLANSEQERLALHDELEAAQERIAWLRSLVYGGAQRGGAAERGGGEGHDD